MRYHDRGPRYQGTPEDIDNALKEMEARQLLRSTRQQSRRGEAAMERTLEIGDHVIFITTERKQVNALVTCVHRAGLTSSEEFFKTYSNYPCVNLLFVTP